MSVTVRDPQPNVGDTIARMLRAGSDRWEPRKERPHTSLSPAPCSQEAVLSLSLQIPPFNPRTRSDPRASSSTLNSIATMAIGILSTSSALSTGPIDVPNVGPFQQNRFEELVQRLKEALGPSSGLTCDDVDVDFLTRLMQDYDGSDMEWSRYAFGDHTRGYTRNLVDEGNGKSNLVSLFRSTRPSPAVTDALHSLSLYGLLERGALSTTTAEPTAS